MKAKTKIAAMAIFAIFFTLFTIASEAITIDIASPGIITGFVSDESTKIPIGHATVDLFSAKDSLLVAGTISNADGSFNISMLDPGEYYLVISCFGFQKKQIQPVHISESTGKIQLGTVSMSILKEDRKKRPGKHRIKT